MAARAKVGISPAEYLALDRVADEKREFIDGEIIAMAGGTEAHDLISGNLFVILRSRLRGRCRVYTSNMRVQIHPSGMYAYPDLTVVCNKTQLADKRLDIILNPTFVVEVLSPSTAKMDRGRKSELYEALPSLKEYLLIAQDHPNIEHHVRQPNGQWKPAEFDGMDKVIVLESLGCSLTMAETYEEVDFNEG